MRNLTLNLKQNLLKFWQSSKFFRVWIYVLSVAAVLGFIAWGVLSLLAMGRVETAQVLFENQIISKAQSSSQTAQSASGAEQNSSSAAQNLNGTAQNNAAQTLKFTLKLHHFTSPIFRHQRDISHIKITSISWSPELDKNAIIDIKPANNGKDANKFLKIHTTQDLNSLKHASLGIAEYETSFLPLPIGIAKYYFGLIFAAFILIILWRHFKLYTLLALAFLAFCDFVISISDERLTLVPFGLIGLAGFGLCVFIAFRAKNHKAKMIFAYVSVLPLCFGIVEFWLFTKSKAQMTRPHEILGYANTPLYDGVAKFIVDDKVVYDVRYKHDGYGNRITPNNNENSKKCLTIYGGSFAYGSAVNGDETLEAFLAKNLPEFRVLNLGIGGTGAHTALARLEFDIDKNVLKNCEEFIAIYEAIPHHIYRAYGASLGPHYRLDKEGVAEYWGTFKKGNPEWLENFKNGEYTYARFHNKTPPKIVSKPTQEITRKKFHNALKNALKIFNVARLAKSEKSYIRQALNKRTSFTSQEVMSWYQNGQQFASNNDLVKFGVDEIPLYFAIVKKIDKVLKEKFGAPLHIVLWDYDMHAQFLDKYDTTLKENFVKMGIKFWSLSEMIEDYTQDFERVKMGDFDNFKYRVSRWDTHPNALANEKIAEFLVEKIKNGEIKSYKVKSTQNTTKDTK